MLRLGHRGEGLHERERLPQVGRDRGRNRILTFPQSVATGDFNGDAKLDLAVASRGGVVVLLGNGTGTFLAAANYPAGSGPQSVATGDFNGDARLDLAAANGGGVSVLLNIACLP